MQWTSEPHKQPSDQINWEKQKPTTADKKIGEQNWHGRRRRAAGTWTDGPAAAPRHGGRRRWRRCGHGRRLGDSGIDSGPAECGSSILEQQKSPLAVLAVRARNHGRTLPTAPAANPWPQPKIPQIQRKSPSTSINPHPNLHPSANRWGKLQIKGENRQTHIPPELWQW